MNRIARRWRGVQGVLSRGVEAGLEEPLTAKQRELLSVLEVVRIEEHIGEVRRWCGRPRESRRATGRQTAQRVTARYEVMDSAYAAPETEQVVRELGHVPIIDRPGSQKKQGLALDPATAQ